MDRLPTSRQTADRRPPLEPGRVLLGRFEVVSLLGQGGMGSVFLARHVALDMAVAIKVLREPLSTESTDHSRRRFANEARTLARIRSEYVCRPLDFGTLESGEPYLVIEYLDGISLDQYAARARDGGSSLSVASAVDLGLQCAAGLAEAHRIGLVHRDVKPSNVIVVRGAGKPARPIAKLVDFGLSKAVGLAHSITSSGRIVGTPEFMSPEQIRGAAIDHRTDVWSLGIMLFWMLTGRYPFEGATSAAVLASILDAPARELSSLRPDLPGALCQAVDDCFMKNPVDRMPWMGALAARLVPFASLSGAYAAEAVQATHVLATATNDAPLRAVAVAALQESDADTVSGPESEAPATIPNVLSPSQPTTRAAIEFTTPKRR